jgi:capsular exopolysaccharide synthesis family protein
MKRLSHGGAVLHVHDAAMLARVNLQLMMHRAGRDVMSPQQVILLTSAAPREGKSFAASQLARSIAATGNRVVLVDANLRNPAQTALFDVAPEAGLAEVLYGQLSVKEALKPSGYDNLSLLHGGTVAGNPTDLLASSNLGDLISDLRQHADTIIIDAPDCNTVSDTVLLARHSDVLIQVIGIDRVTDDTMMETAIAIHASGKTNAFLINLSPRQRRNRILASRSIFHAFAALSAPQNGQSPNSTWPSLAKHIRTAEVEPAREIILAKGSKTNRE